MPHSKKQNPVRKIMSKVVFVLCIPLIIITFLNMFFVAFLSILPFPRRVKKLMLDIISMVSITCAWLIYQLGKLDYDEEYLQYKKQNEKGESNYQIRGH